MSFISNSLAKDEQIIRETKISKVALIPNIIFVLIFAIMSIITRKDIILKSFFFAILIFVSIIFLFKMFIILGIELGFTNKRVIGKVGIIGRSSLEAPLSKIQNVAISSGLFGRIFGYGTIIISTAGAITGGYRFKAVKDAESFKKALMQAIDDADNSKKQ